MKVSIIIPSYNQEDYLEESIESALKQTVPCEIVVIDDGSTDGSLVLAKDYAKHAGIKLVSQVNKGLASARNTGIMNATGDYILPLDADDILKPNCVERILEIEAKTHSDVIAVSIQCFGVGDTPVIVMENPKLEDFKHGNRLAYCAAIKRSVLLECGGYSPRMDKGWEDLHLWYDLMIRGKKIVTIQEPLMMYRTKATSMWTEARDKYGDILWNQIIKDFPQVSSHRK